MVSPGERRSCQSALFSPEGPGFKPGLSLKHLCSENALCQICYLNEDYILMNNLVDCGVSQAGWKRHAVFHISKLDGSK